MSQRDPVKSHACDHHGRVILRRRAFPEAVRRILGLPADAEDADVYAEIAVLRYEAGRVK